MSNLESKEGKVIVGKQKWQGKNCFGGEIFQKHRQTKQKQKRSGAKHSFRQN